MAAQETNIKYPQHPHMLMWLLCSLCLHRVEALLQAIAQVAGGVVEVLALLVLKLSPDPGTEGHRAK